jgi:hypothetical protein
MSFSVQGPTPINPDDQRSLILSVAGTNPSMRAVVLFIWIHGTVHTIHC